MDQEEDGRETTLMPKRAPNFKIEETKFLFTKFKSNKGILFATLGPVLIFAKKMEEWMIVRNYLISAGYPKRSKEQQKLENQSSLT